jgi:hypothetical protein
MAELLEVELWDASRKVCVLGIGPRQIMPRSTKSKPQEVQRHDPLQKQLHDDYVLARYGRVSNPSRRQREEAGDDELDQQVPQSNFFSFA